MLGYSSSWSRSEAGVLASSPLRGVRTNEVSASDTARVDIPIDIIKEANIKLIERKYLIEVLKVKDSTINSYKKYKVANDSIIGSYNKQLNEQIKITNELRRRLEINKTTSVYKYVGCGVIGLILGLVIMK